MKTRRVVAGLVLGLVSLVSVSGVQAGHYERIEKLVCQLQTNAHKLNGEIVSQYRMLPQFGCLSTETGQIMALASQVREPIQCGNVAQLNQILCQVERLSRHVQDELDNVDDLSRHSHRGDSACRVDTRRAYRFAEDVEDDATDLKAESRHLPVPQFSNYRPLPQSNFLNSQPFEYGDGDEPIAPSHGAPTYFGSGSRSSIYVPGPRPGSCRPIFQFGSGGIRINIGN